MDFLDHLSRFKNFPFSRVASFFAVLMATISFSVIEGDSSVSVALADAPSCESVSGEAANDTLVTKADTQNPELFISCSGFLQ